jgi:hypothetical protein
MPRPPTTARSSSARWPAPVPDPIASQPLSPDSPGGLSFTIALPPAGRHLLGARAALALDVELLT